MPANLLRPCLNALAAKNQITLEQKSNPIEYIETAYDREDFLEEVCRSMQKSPHAPYVYDKKRTEAQIDVCVCKNGDCEQHYMYPSDCPRILGDKYAFLTCEHKNGCSNKNYKGFYCKGINK